MFLTILRLTLSEEYYEFKFYFTEQTRVVRIQVDMMLRKLFRQDDKHLPGPRTRNYL